MGRDQPMGRQGVVGVMGTGMGLERLMRARWFSNWEMPKYEVYSVLFLQKVIRNANF